MLTLSDARDYLKADPADDTVVQALLTTALSVFRVESKRRWPAAGEPALVVVTDPATDPPTTQFVRYVDEAVLSPDEQQIALHWMRFTLAHWYENRQTVAVGLNVMEVPHTAQRLMNLLRTPTL